VQSYPSHHLHHYNGRYNITHDLFEATNLSHFLAYHARSSPAPCNSYQSRHLHHYNCRYNVTHDLFEATNLALEFPEVVTRLEAQLMAWVDSMPTTPPDKIVLNAGCDRMSSFGHVTPIEVNGWGATEFDLA
jgi:hypothetical protein